VDLVQPTYFTSSVLEDSYKFDGLITTNYGFRALVLGGMCMKTTIMNNATMCQLTLAVVVVVRWSKDHDVVFIMFRVLSTFCEPL
jgi:hypothetical protein